MDAAEVKMRVIGGSDIGRVLLDISKNVETITASLTRQRKAIDDATKATKEMEKAAKDRAKSEAQYAKEWEKVAVAAAKEKERAEKRAAKESENATKEATREKIKAEKEAEAETTRMLKRLERDQKEELRNVAKAAKDAAKDRINAERELEQAARKTEAAYKAQANAVIKVGSGAVNMVKNTAQVAGVPSASSMKEKADEVEELLVRTRSSLGLADVTNPRKVKEWESLNAKEVFKKASLESGLSPKDIIESFIKQQNETSKGRDLMANGGSLMVAQAKAAEAEGSSLGDTATTIAKYSDLFGVSREDQAKIPGSLHMQQLQGSLEAKSAQKFIQSGYGWKALTGQTGLTGLTTMLAFGNVVKDVPGLTGENGAARAATWFNSSIDALRKGKGIGATDTSAGAILKKYIGHDIFDKEGHMDPMKFLGDLKNLKSQKGDKKFGEIMGMAFRNVNSKKGWEALLDRYSKGSSAENSIENLSNPDANEGAKEIAGTGALLAETANAKKSKNETNEIFGTLNNKGNADSFMDKAREKIGGFISEHPLLAISSPIWSPLAGWLGKKGAQAAVQSPLVRGAIQTGAEAAATPAGLAAGALFLPGDTRAPRSVEVENQIGDLEKRIKRREVNKSGERGSFGDFTGWDTTEDLKSKLASLKNEQGQIVVPPANVNLTVILNAAGQEARVISEQAHPTNALARGTGGRPQTTPGKQ